MREREEYQKKDKGSANIYCTSNVVEGKTDKVLAFVQAAFYMRSLVEPRKRGLKQSKEIGGDKGGRETIKDELKFEQRPQSDEELNPVNIWAECVTGKGKFRGPRRACLENQHKGQCGLCGLSCKRITLAAG